METRFVHRISCTRLLARRLRHIPLRVGVSLVIALRKRGKRASGNAAVAGCRNVATAAPSDTGVMPQKISGLGRAQGPDNRRAKRDRPSTSTTRAPSNTASTHTMKASAIRRPERWLAAWWRSAGNGDIDSHRPWRCSPSPLVAGQVEGARQNVGIERHSLAVCTRTSPLIAARCEQRED